MGRGDKVFCVLCQRSEETEITGALSTKDEVTAHQNCLLYSSGIYCRDTPEFDDLFGFSVEDVLEEVKRGKFLVCNKCKKKGATAGCEVKRCKKSYHYPCAVQEGAKTIENAKEGNYGLYCFKHCEHDQNNGYVNGCASSSTKPQTSKNPSKSGSSKVYCLACEKTEGNIRLESLSNSIIMLYCDKHAPPSQKRNASDDSTAAGPSAYSSDSNSSSSVSRLSKRPLCFSVKLEGIPSKRKSKACKRILSEDSSNSDENELNTEMAIFAPLDSDLDETANSVPESQLIRKETKSPTASTSANQLEDESRDGKKEDETIIDSDAESESLLLPVSTADPGVMSKKAVKLVERENKGSSPEQSPSHSSGQHTAGPSVAHQTTAGPSVPQQMSTGPPLSPDHSKHCSGTISPLCTTLASPSPTVRPSDPEPSVDSTGFWKSCNAAGCTQAIFTDFINEMDHISSRIQSDQASQEDYDLALKVMLASGKLAELVTSQRKELQRKQMELQKAAAAMKDAISALRR